MSSSQSACIFYQLTSSCFRCALCESAQAHSDQLVPLLTREGAMRWDKLSGKEALNLAWAFAKMEARLEDESL